MLRQRQNLTLFSLSLALALSPLVTALTLTSPSPNMQINPSLPLTITWTSTPSDPSTISLLLIHSSGNIDNLATDIPTSSGSYTVPAWWVLDYGIGYELQAQAGSGGDVVATVSGLSLGGGVGEITTDATGGLSFVSDVGIATASQDGPASVTGSDLVTILSGSGSGSAEATGSAEASGAEETGSVASTTTATATSGEASETTTTSTESESGSASRTESAAATSSSAGGGAASALRVTVGGVLGAAALALMA
ncbi:uncharacterized protein HMPREF1541_02374 [Cyphellophora europaea CBS 101466]|uniref:Yeast cell wall synthesis Kre9/Knh1-like N-terminal domain-containing protein n=1 Tax=Cyphellophora europaea (strain CBS 101466) TaxID=1220924 RepID=W2S3N3_CYPE1|nr:uncharacterized protein HMPREF1541_02374 [Cyphellophora europaea CBS 101466]ETN43215.1 hypothetical protein HMPREF1541_02374 [Cyphellophora europaea CBS 101466]